MTVFVVDSSVAVKWYVPEVHTDRARKLLDEYTELHAPDLLYPEFGNILWKKVGRGQLADREAQSIVRALTTVPLRIHSSANLLEAAVGIALHTSRAVYDSLYIALAVGLNCSLMTADDRLLNALRNSPFAPYVRHVKTN